MIVLWAINKVRAFGLATQAALLAVFRGSRIGRSTVYEPFDVDAIRDTVTISPAARQALATRPAEMAA
jgi:hypothetical protein